MTFSDPVIRSQLAALLRRGLARHRAREASGEPEPPEITRERQEIADMLRRRRAYLIVEQGGRQPPNPPPPPQTRTEPPPPPRQVSRPTRPAD